MKKIVILLTFVTLIYSCTNKKENVVEQKNTDSVVNIVDETQTPLQTETKNLEDLDASKYYVIVGAFREEWRCDLWDSIVAADFGYKTDKVLSHNGFYMTYITAGDDFKTAIRIMENFRTCGKPSWVYVKR